MERKRVTLHPLKEDGSIDLNVNLYPKTLLSGIVDDNGEEVSVVTEDELENIDEKVDDKQDKLISGETIKTLNGQSVLGQGNIKINVDLSDYPTNEDMERALSDKQEKLVSGTNIKTVNNEPLLGSGDITIPSGTTVEANPDVSGKEDSLTSIKIGDRNYIVGGGGGGSSVTPNPEDLDPNSDTWLSGLKIDNTNYYIPTQEAIRLLTLSDENSFLHIDDIVNNNDFNTLYDFISAKMFPGNEEEYPYWAEKGSPIFLVHYRDEKEITLIPGIVYVHDYSWKGEPQDASLRNISSLSVDIVCSNGYVSLTYSKNFLDRYTWTIEENTLNWNNQPSPRKGPSLSVKNLDCGNKKLLSIKQLVLVNEENEEEHTIYDASSRATAYIPSYIVANGYNEPIITNAFPELAIEPRSGVALAHITNVVVVEGMGSESTEMHNTRYHINRMHHYDGLQNYPDNMLFITTVDGITKSIDDVALVIFYRENEQ